MRTRYKIAVLAVVVSLTFFLTRTASAQLGFSNHSFGGATIHGTPPSVTSFGFGGNPTFHGVPPSVTSLNFGRVPIHGFHPVPIGVSRHRFGRGFVSPYIGGYYIPYGYDYYDSDYNVMEPGVDDSMEQTYAAGPTIFDRNGVPPPPMQPPAEDYRTQLNPQPAPEQPVADQPDTVLVFRDGHQAEVRNYAIVGKALYDLSDGRTRKIELADLDLPATVKQNDDRGVSFQLPAGKKLN
jgi:hypothetical protein